MKRPSIRVSSEEYPPTPNPLYSYRPLPWSRFCSMLFAPWGSRFEGSMQRLTARLLLLFALTGNIVPLALAVTAAPPHTCCVRKAAHQQRCHEPADGDSSQLVVRDTGCCDHDCCRAVTTAQWAHPQRPMNLLGMQNVGSRLDRPLPLSLSLEVIDLRSSRSPPAYRS